MKQRSMISKSTSKELQSCSAIIVDTSGKTKEIPLTENDLVFVTNGSITESSTQGDHHTPAPITHELGEVGISGKLSKTIPRIWAPRSFL